VKRSDAMLVVAAVAASIVGCSQDQGEAPSATASSAPPAPAASASVAASAAASATATADVPAHDCPAGTSGKGTFKEPCAAKGTARMMTVEWTGKTSDEGPSFRVTNKSKLPILYGNVLVYFYDKAGKQLEVEVAGESGSKTRPNRVCGGSIFAGVMKPGETAVLKFSCVKKDHVPEGAAAIEAEMEMVGFADESGKKSEYYWKNGDLTPKERPKGGVK
jgi:hypothetical protein